MDKAIGYCRISTKDQSHYSLEYQERRVQQFCMQNKIECIAIFKDDGESSYTFDRPDWIALEDFIKKNSNVGYLILLDHDRFSRNLAEALLKIKELHDKYAIKVLSCSDSIETDFSDPNAFLMRAFKFMLAESELHNIRKRTKNGMIQAAINGRHANMAPYGYINARDENDKPILLIDEIKAEIVRKIYREYLSGMDIEQLRKVANKIGYTQKGHSALQNILSNRIYCGYVKVPPHKDRKSEYVKGLHSPIISEHDYWIVQERLNKRVHAVQKREEVFLRGSLRCWCGRKLTAGNSRSHTGKHYWYYVCPSNDHKYNLSAKKLHLQFYEILNQCSVEESRIQWLKEKMISKINDRARDAEKNIRAEKEHIRLIKEKIKTVERKYLLRANVSEITFNQTISELHTELSLHEKKLASFDVSYDVYIDRLNETLPKLNNLKETFEMMSLEKQQRFIDIGFDKFLFYENDIYRTYNLHEMFSDKELILKEKGLLRVEKPIIKLGVTPVRTQNRNDIEPLLQMIELIA
jgi:site-specific DNA recombinase